MKKIIFLLAVSAFVACKSNENKNASEAQDTTKVSTEQTIYTCPMHPEVISDKPGTCPQCGMDLEVKS
jgi:Cu(I)/Ag(I) efflux system membrane fusion protein